MWALNRDSLKGFPCVDHPGLPPTASTPGGVWGQLRTTVPRRDTPVVLSLLTLRVKQTKPPDYGTPGRGGPPDRDGDRVTPTLALAPDRNGIRSQRSQRVSSIQDPTEYEKTEGPVTAWAPLPSRRQRQCLPFYSGSLLCQMRPRSSESRLVHRSSVLSSDVPLYGRFGSEKRRGQKKLDGRSGGNGLKC